MNNKEVCEYVRTLDPHINSIKEEYISDLCVKEGYGQSCGGYLMSCKKDRTILEEISQKDHFLNYYSDKGNKFLTYHYLRCPQLLLFIAEIAGVLSEDLKNAYRIVKVYENANQLRNKDKNGNYMWGTESFRDFKSKIHINEVVKIIKDAENWDAVRDETKKL